MKRTTVFFDAQTLQRLQLAAQRRGVSSASMVREAVALYLSAPPTATPVPSILGQFASGHTDTASKVDDLLWGSAHE